MRTICTFTNTNAMKKNTIICYGDSNTYGYDPRGYLGGRYDEPWPELLARLTGWTIRNNGACGREIPRRETVFGREYDLVLVMLGTNDLLQGASAEAAAARMETFLRTQDPGRVLLIAPPKFIRGEWVPDDALIDASAELAVRYRALSRQLGIRFLDAGEWRIPLGYDGVHFTEAGHRIFAEKLKEAIFHA